MIPGFDVPHIPKRMKTKTPLPPMQKAPLASENSKDSLGIFEDIPVESEEPERDKPDVQNARPRRKKISALNSLSMKDWDVDPDSLMQSMFG